MVFGRSVNVEKDEVGSVLLSARMTMYEREDVDARPIIHQSGFHTIYS